LKPKTTEQLRLERVRLERLRQNVEAELSSEILTPAQRASAEAKLRRLDSYDVYLKVLELPVPAHPKEAKRIKL